jgi:hypothetical protein
MSDPGPKGKSCCGGTMKKAGSMCIECPRNSGWQMTRKGEWGKLHSHQGEQSESVHKSHIALAMQWTTSGAPSATIHSGSGSPAAAAAAAAAAAPAAWSPFSGEAERYLPLISGEAAMERELLLLRMPSPLLVRANGMPLLLPASS